MSPLRLADVAAELQCSVRTLMRAINSGDLRASQTQKRGGWVVQREDLQAFLDAKATRPRGQPIRTVTRQPRGASSPGGRLVIDKGMGRRAA